MVVRRYILYRCILSLLIKLNIHKKGLSSRTTKISSANLLALLYHRLHFENCVNCEGTTTKASCFELCFLFLLRHVLPLSLSLSLSLSVCLAVCISRLIRIQLSVSMCLFAITTGKTFTSCFLLVCSKVPICSHFAHSQVMYAFSTPSY